MKDKLTVINWQALCDLFILKGEIASVTFVAGNPRHSGDIVSSLAAVTLAKLALYVWYITNLWWL